MREVNKIKKKKAEQARISVEDFMKALGDTKVESFTMMLRTDSYAFKIKKYLLEDKKLSVRGFLYNDNIFNLPLGKKDDEGNLLIDNGIMELFDRFMFSAELVKNGDALTAFIVDHDDTLYNILKDNTSEEKKMTEEDYIREFNSAYTRLSRAVLDSNINTYMSDNEEIVAELLKSATEIKK
jgi:hypothetical protein